MAVFPHETDGPIRFGNWNKRVKPTSIMRLRSLSSSVSTFFLAWNGTRWIGCCTGATFRSMCNSKSFSKTVPWNTSEYWLMISLVVVGVSGSWTVAVLMLGEGSLTRRRLIPQMSILKVGSPIFLGWRRTLFLFGFHLRMLLRETCHRLVVVYQHCIQRFWYWMELVLVSDPKVHMFGSQVDWEKSLWGFIECQCCWL